MYSLTFRVRVTTPPQYGRNGTASLQITSRTQQARRFYRWRGKSSPACVVRAVGMADYRWALPHISSVAIATQPVHRDCKSAQQCTTMGHPLTLPQVTSGSVQQCNHAAADRHAHRHTDRQTHRRALPQYISRRLRLTRNVKRRGNMDRQRCLVDWTRAGSDSFPKMQQNDTPNKLINRNVHSSLLQCSHGSCHEYTRSKKAAGKETMNIIDTKTVKETTTETRAHRTVS